MNAQKLLATTIHDIHSNRNSEIRKCLNHIITQAETILPKKGYQGNTEAMITAAKAITGNMVEKVATLLHQTTELIAVKRHWAHPWARTFTQQAIMLIVMHCQEEKAQSGTLDDYIGQDKM